MDNRCGSSEPTWPGGYLVIVRIRANAFALQKYPHCDGLRGSRHQALAVRRARSRTRSRHCRWARACPCRRARARRWLRSLAEQPREAGAMPRIPGLGLQDRRRPAQTARAASARTPRAEGEPRGDLQTHVDPECASADEGTSPHDPWQRSYPHPREHRFSLQGSGTARRRLRTAPLGGDVAADLTGSTARGIRRPPAGAARHAAATRRAFP